MVEYVLGGIIALSLVMLIYGSIIYFAFKIRKDDEKNIDENSWKL